MTTILTGFFTAIVLCGVLVLILSAILLTFLAIERVFLSKKGDKDEPE
jgi:hypothetical protein